MPGQQLIVSVSGVRGIVGETLTPDVALRFAQALGTWARGGAVVLGRDSRPSGAMLGQAVAAGLNACGCTVYDLGVAPTPTVGVVIRQLKAAAGIQVSASHNPAPYNGLKLFGPEGNVLPARDGADVLQIHETSAFTRRPWDQTGLVVPAAGAVRVHLAKVLAQVDVEAIAQRRYRVLVDANHGAGGALAWDLLKNELGCAPTLLGLDAHGRFAHEPEPTEANLATVCQAMRQAAPPFDVGFALDPDADRLAILDEHGNYVGEELTLALAMEFRLREAQGPVVVNMSTSRVTEDVARKHGCSFHRSAVGEANVVERMREVGAVIGGEGNGGVIDPRVGWVRDPFIAMAMLLNLLAATGKTVSQLVAELPRYVIVKEKYEIGRSGLPALYQRLRDRWGDARASTLDGLRLDWSDRWFHVRPSNTEPIVRVIAEAPRDHDARALCQEVGRTLGQITTN